MDGRLPTKISASERCDQGGNRLRHRGSERRRVVPNSGYQKQYFGSANFTRYSSKKGYINDNEEVKIANEYKDS